VIDRLIEAETVGELSVGGVTQHHRAAADHHRHVVDGDPELIQERLDAGITVEVDGRVGVAVARQERLDAERVRGMARPDEHDIAEPMCDQLRPAQDEGPHEDLAQLAVGLHEGQQGLTLELDHSARLARADADEPAAAREHRHLPGELPRSQDGHERLRDACWPDQLDLTRGDDEAPRERCTRLGQHLTALHLTHVPVRLETRDLGRRQRRKHLVAR
jgi:hypothetical protein